MSQNNQSENFSWRIIVSGRVQGVYFRAFTRKQALQLGLSGYAKNLPNGDVEIVASGSEPALQQLADWARKGPILAKVRQLSITPFVAKKQFSSFTIC